MTHLQPSGLSFYGVRLSGIEVVPYNIKFTKKYLVKLRYQYSDVLYGPNFGSKHCEHAEHVTSI